MPDVSGSGKKMTKELKKKRFICKLFKDILLILCIYYEKLHLLFWL